MKPIDKWADAYEPSEFAAKHGLTLDQAKAVISSNGPSRHSCDMGAKAFVRALETKRDRQSGAGK
ncbi:hypothetical protein FJ964_23620 [Mesorhizobium sp. B2-3-2]|nr:hypothetical protein FJ964_23620 [Mesorhizobium sp. B2-3-2]